MGAWYYVRSFCSSFTPATQKDLAKTEQQILETTEQAIQKMKDSTHEAINALAADLEKRIQEKIDTSIDDNAKKIGELQEAIQQAKEKACEKIETESALSLKDLEGKFSLHTRTNTEQIDNFLASITLLMNSNHATLQEKLKEREHALQTTQKSYKSIRKHTKKLIKKNNFTTETSIQENGHKLIKQLSDNALDVQQLSAEHKENFIALQQQVLLIKEDNERNNQKIKTFAQRLRSVTKRYQEINPHAPSLRPHLTHGNAARALASTT